MTPLLISCTGAFGSYYIAFDQISFKSAQADSAPEFVYLSFWFIQHLVDNSFKSVHADSALEFVTVI